MIKNIITGIIPINCLHHSGVNIGSQGISGLSPQVEFDKHIERAIKQGKANKIRLIICMLTKNLRAFSFSRKTPIPKMIFITIIENATKKYTGVSKSQNMEKYSKIRFIVICAIQSIFIPNGLSLLTPCNHYLPLLICICGFFANLKTPFICLAILTTFTICCGII